MRIRRTLTTLFLAIMVASIFQTNDGTSPLPTGATVFNPSTHWILYCDDNWTGWFGCGG